jgi:hypothetical protein
MLNIFFVLGKLSIQKLGFLKEILIMVLIKFGYPE